MVLSINRHISAHFMKTQKFLNILIKVYSPLTTRNNFYNISGQSHVQPYMRRPYRFQSVIIHTNGIHTVNRRKLLSKRSCKCGRCCRNSLREQNILQSSNAYLSPYSSILSLLRFQSRLRFFLPKPLRPQ